MNPLMFLADGTTGFSVDTALSNGTKLLNWVLEVVEGNEVLATAFVVVVLVPAALGIFKSLKHSV